MTKKIDGIIEAARYKNGQIIIVRAYERRGATFSDRILLERKTLLERLQKGQTYLTGSREELRASTFKVGKPVLVVKLDDRELLATRANATHDELEEVPIF
jgi:Zn-dependent peptidase ImmA (M78 family)